MSKDFGSELKAFFPELYTLYAISRKDKKILKLLKTLAEFHKMRHYGKVEVGYQDGVINHILKTISVK